MMCPAAVRVAAVAAVAGWLLAVLSPGLSFPAEEDSNFSICRHCFYRQMPPQGDSAGTLLRPLCHKLPGGQAFATLYNPTCDTAAYSAFHLRHGWAESGGEEERELVIENEEDDFQVVTPALLRGGVGAPDLASPVGSPLQQWDSLITALVQSGISPQCDSTEGNLYILTGTGGAGPAADGGEEECKAGLLWSAVCCASTEGEGWFSVGLVRETDGGERAVGVKELEEILGVTELFSGGCGATDGQTDRSIVGLLAEALPGIKAKLGSDTAVDESDENVGESVESPITGEQAASLDAQPEEAEVDDVTEKASPQEVISESASEEQGEETPVRSSESVGPSDSKEASAEAETGAEAETAAEAESDTESNSTLLYIISSTFSLLIAPLQPVFSTIAQLPGQVTYVLLEDLRVLSVLPGDTFSLFHLMASDLLSAVGSATDLLLGLGETCFSGMYHCSSSMLGALYISCHTGVTGVGTLAGDTVGIFGGAVDNAWWVTRLFGGRLWEHSEGYVGAVVTEMGGQAKAVGGGLGGLAWRGGIGVVNVVRTGGGLIVGTVETVIAGVREAFGQESD